VPKCRNIARAPGLRRCPVLREPKVLFQPFKA
jgi:hypothetical protein